MNLENGESHIKEKKVKIYFEVSFFGEFATTFVVLSAAVVAALMRIMKVTALQRHLSMPKIYYTKQTLILDTMKVTCHKKR